VLGRAADALAAPDGKARRKVAGADAGVSELDARQPGTWLELDQATQVAALRDLESGEFFQHVLQTTKMVLFNDPQVWAYLGYGGSSLDFGGYLGRGLNDIDWLGEG